MEWVEAGAWCVVGLLAVPLSVFTLECLVALRRWRTGPPPDPATRPRTVVLIPAHNEEEGITRTLTQVIAQLGPEDRVLVVADNCTDATAGVARGCGATVLERSDPVRRGKGYALAFGRAAMAEDPPSVVIVMDADCLPDEHALLRLADAATRFDRPVQAAYLMTAPAGSGPSRQIAAFAFLIKNVVRPLGLKRLGFHSLLTGTGMAFPWQRFKAASLDHGHIVEDLGLAVDLALLGHPPVFLPDAEVRGEFPVDDRAAGSQRRRWEHGHLRILFANVPRLLAASICRVRVGLAVLALDIGVPPLSSLVMISFATLFILTLWAALGGPWAPAATLGVIGLTASLSLLLAWCRYGRGILPAKTLLRIPSYALGKIPLYLGFLTRPQQEWVRTARNEPGEAPTRPDPGDASGVASPK